MGEGDHDLAEILRSPLDPDPDDPGPRHWPATILAFLAGGFIALLSMNAVLGSPEPPVATMPPETTDPLPRVVAAPTPYPDDYTAISNDVAVRAEAPVVEEERVLVPLTMVVRRGADPTAVSRPLGGRWELRSERGVLQSQRLVFDPSLPGVLSVEFGPVAGPLPDEIVMVERWDAEAASARVELPWPGIPFESDQPVSIDLGQGVEAVLTRVELGNLLGQVRWELHGAPLGVVAIDVELLDVAGGVFGSYVATSHVLDPEPRQGHFDYFWGPGFRVDQDEAATLRIAAEVNIGTPVPVEITVPLTSGS